jgi:RNAse (barnase) inhibitor barstar
MELDSGETDLLGTGGPWVHRLSHRRAEEVLAPVRGGTSVIVELDGTRMQDLTQFFVEYARAFRFPDYFGANWPAFDECLGDLDWLPSHAYTTVITSGESLLRDFPVEREIFSRVVSDVGRRWAGSFGLGPAWGGGEVPFHTVLVFSSGD